MVNNEDYEDIIGVEDVVYEDRYIPTKEQLDSAEKLAKEEFEKIAKEQQKWKDQNPGKELPKAKLTKLIIIDEFGKVIGNKQN